MCVPIILPERRMVVAIMVIGPPARAIEVGSSDFDGSWMIKTKHIEVQSERRWHGIGCETSM